MAVDKLVDSAKLDACLDAEADAIRAKTGGSADIPFDYANSKGFADAIAAIPSGGGGMSWELIADYTNDAAAEVVMVTIPSGKQDANIYRVHYKCDTSIYYSKCGINSNYGGYSGQTKWDCDVYIVKSVVGTNAVSGTSAAAHYSMYAPTLTPGTPGLSIASAPLESVGMQAYQSSQPIPAGMNIKVWRLVEP